MAYKLLEIKQTRRIPWKAIKAFEVKVIKYPNQWGSFEYQRDYAWIYDSELM